MDDCELIPEQYTMRFGSHYHGELNSSPISTDKVLRRIGSHVNTASSLIWLHIVVAGLFCIFRKQCLPFLPPACGGMSCIIYCRITTCMF